jgi:two-component system, NtrC family, sensor kinase
MDLSQFFPVLAAHFQIVLLMVSLAMTIAIIVRAFREKSRPAVRAFSWLMISLAWWLAGAIIENTRQVPLDRIFWMKLEYVGITLVPVFWLLFTFRYTEKKNGYSGIRQLWFYIIPMITLVMVWTNESHGLIWPNLIGDLSSTANGVTFHHGLWFWIHTVYSYSLLMIGNFILFLHYIRNKGLIRRRAGVMLLASFIPWVANLLFVLSNSPGFNIDPTPVAFAVTGIVILWGLSQANLLNFMPVAYETIFRNIGDGVIVLDEKNRIRDINKAAETIFNTRRSEILDDKLNRLIPPGAILRQTLDERISPPTTIVLGENYPRAYFTVAVTPIFGKHAVNGRLVIFHDDTARREMELRTAEKARLEAELKARREMQNALTESSERLKALSEESPVMICNFNIFGLISYVNKKFELITGYSREEILGKNVFSRDNFDHDTIQLIKERIQLKIDGLSIGPVEVKFSCKNKSQIWLSLLAEPILEQNKVTGFQVIGQDVTGRKKIEEKLRKTEENYRTIFESANDTIILTDKNYNIIDVNQKVNKVGGYKRENLIGRNFKEMTDIMPAASLNTIIEQFTKKMNGEYMPPFEIEMYRGNGERVNIEVNGVLLQDGETVVGRLLTLRDITERIKSEQVLRYQRELIDQMIAAMPSAVAIVGPDTHLLLANKSFQKLFNITDIKNLALGETVPVKELEAAVKSVIRTDVKETYLEFRMNVAGNPYIFTADIVKMHNDRSLVMLNDVSEERAKQERIYLTDRLISIGEIASGVAHELNNPLTSIIGLSGMLAKENFEKETREDLSAIKSEAERCAAIVRNLLTFARKHAVKREAVHVGKIVEDVLKLRSYELNAQNIKVETRFEPDLPEIMADYFQMQQVFLNLILNAESAMLGANGSGTLKISGLLVDEHVNVSFADDGPGILPQNVKNLFTPFFTTKEVGKGTGLGLSISYGIVTSHGGKIYLGDSGGKGANFIVELPIMTG